ncbi:MULTISPECIES: RHS repeat-associated core domain-containing protein, partial [Spirulina sp. CCY15215]|uniref:RHS repeat domain-containing protein n=1 Tax=Spirulina sp. CCY15215 TaxID=2767591 RepID=UPI0019507DAA
KVTDPTNTQATILIYDEVNRLEERTLPNGIKTVYTYKENTDFIEKIVHYAPDGVTVMSSVEYIRSDSGEPTKITREDGSYVELKYDESLRLEKETYYDANGVQEEEIIYTYDEMGNRKTVSGGEAQGSYDYENIHQLTQIDTGEGLETYYYDDGGRLETITREGKTWQLRYNANDLIVEVKKGENIVVQYAYDSAGRRVEMTDGTGEKDYVVAPLMGEGLESPHLVMDGSNDPLAAYVYAGNMPLMRLDEQGNPTYYLEDGMGSIVGLANNSGVEVAEFEYDSFGNLRNNPVGMPNELGGDFRFQGQWLESNTDFYHFRARYYDPETGRFVSRDPIDVIEYEPESSNPYQFVYNNPHIYSDPTGLFTLAELNTSMKMQDILNGVKSQLLDEAKDYFVDKAQGVAGDLIQSAMQRFMPIYQPRITSAINVDDYMGTGDIFGSIGWAKDALCSVLGGLGFVDYLWLEPKIDTFDGTAHTSGYNCGIDDDEEKDRLSNGSVRFPLRGTTAKPDYIISAYPPNRRNLRYKDLLIGDFKYSVTNLHTDYVRGGNEQQWSAIHKRANYLSNFQYIPMTFFMTLRPASSMAQYEALKKEATDKGVIMFIYSFQSFRPRRPGVKIP